MRRSLERILERPRTPWWHDLVGEQRQGPPGGGHLPSQYGSSFGISALCMGSALKDLGAGRMIETEIEPNKAVAARAYLERAGRDSVVEVREGDARATLRDLDEPIDVLFLDGWIDLYLPITQMLLDHLMPGNVLLADNVKQFRKELRPFRDFLTAPANRFASLTLPLGHGDLEFAVRLAP